MKILFVSENKHSNIGGIETYNRLLANILHSKNYEIYEFSFNLNPENHQEKNKLNFINDLNPYDEEQIKVKKKLSFNQKRKLFKSSLNKIKKIWNEYDLIINSVVNSKWPKSITSSNKWIYVQHFNKDFYKQKYIAGNVLQPIIYFGMWLIGIKNPFKLFKNLVFFSNEDKNGIIKKDYARNIGIIPLARYSEKEIKNFQKNKQEKNKNFYYIGRIDNFQKNIKYVFKVFSRLKMFIDIYGTGNKKIMELKNDYVSFKGKINNNEIYQKIKKYKYNVLLSKYEGFPFSIVEAVSNGIPTISTKNCASSKWLIENKGFIVNNKNINRIILNSLKISDEIYNQMKEECFNFALNNLTIEKFEENWMSFISKIIK